MEIEFEDLRAALFEMIRSLGRTPTAKGGRSRARHLQRAKQICKDAQTKHELLDALGILASCAMEQR